MSDEKDNEIASLKTGFSSIINDADRIKPKETDPQIKIRIPPFFKQVIDIESKKNGRSKTAEILYRLKMSFENNIKKGDVNDK